MALLSLLAATAAIAAQPVGEPQTWITTEDYPEAAVKGNIEGTVRVALSIDPTGKPDGCTVSASSGHPELDAATCDVLLQRARFAPARDESGDAVRSNYVQQVRWAFPHDQLMSGGFRMTYSLDESGRVDGCKVDQFGLEDPDLTCSPQMMEDVAGTFLSKPLTAYSKIAVLLAMQVDDDKGIAVLRPDSGERKVVAAAQIVVSPDGVIAGCKTTVVAQYRGRSLDLCNGPVEIGETAFNPDPEGRERALAVSFELIGIKR